MKIYQTTSSHPRPRAGGALWPRRLLSLGLLLGLSLLAQLAVRAQPTTGGPMPGVDPEPAQVPDGGAPLLLAGGVGYALRRLRQKRPQ